MQIKLNSSCQENTQLCSGERVGANIAKRLHIMNSFESSRTDDSEAKAKKEAKIRRRLELGIPLSGKEMTFLRENNPQMYMIAKKVEIKRKALEERLSHAKTKQEVNDIQLETMANIRKDDPAKKYIMAAVAETVKQFKETGYFKKLPSTEQEVKKLKQESGKCIDFKTKDETKKQHGESAQLSIGELIYEHTTDSGVGAYQLTYIK